MKDRFFVMAAIVASSFIQVAYAHHGIDFITVETVHLPPKGASYAIARVDYISEEEYELEFEPSILYGATDWFAIELHAHFEKEEGDSTKYESLAPAMRIRLTPREQPFSVGLSVEYEFAHDSAEDDVLALNAIFGYEFSGWMFAANVLHEKPSNSSGEWAYAAGVRHSYNEDHGFGLELNGSLENSDSSEVLFGYYGELSKQFSINAGFGTGLGDGPDWSVRTALIWNFR